MGSESSNPVFGEHECSSIQGTCVLCATVVLVETCTLMNMFTLGNTYAPGDTNSLRNVYLGTHMLLYLTYVQGTCVFWETHVLWEHVGSGNLFDLDRMSALGNTCALGTHVLWGIHML